MSVKKKPKPKPVESVERRELAQLLRSCEAFTRAGRSIPSGLTMQVLRYRRYWKKGDLIPAQIVQSQMRHAKLIDITEPWNQPHEQDPQAAHDAFEIERLRTEGM